jgi:UDP-N-acetylmuramate: L-alanyl-gamma-D-glutamyl-meso-diaminopimelate ligase
LRDLGISDKGFLEAMPSFEGAAKRLQCRRSEDGHLIYQDFAHAPSKVKATVHAMKEQFPSRRLTACVELHTFSSLNQQFLPQYAGALNAADNAVVYYSDHTLKMKGMPPITEDAIRKAFDRKDIIVITLRDDLIKTLESQDWINHNLLLMSSGTFDGLDISALKTI